MPGLFIAIDGIDGCGKSTLARAIAGWAFEATRRSVLLTKEPYTYTAEIMAILSELKSPSSSAQQLAELFVKDRQVHVEACIKPALSLGHIVVTDRYKYSTLAYQSSQGIELQRLIAANAIFIPADIALILDIPPERALKRIADRKASIFESAKFLQKVRQAFLELPRWLPRERIVILNADQPKSAVRKAAIRAIQPVLRAL